MKNTKFYSNNSFTKVEFTFSGKSCILENGQTILLRFQLLTSCGNDRTYFARWQWVLLYDERLSIWVRLSFCSVQLKDTPEVRLLRSVMNMQTFFMLCPQRQLHNK